METPTFSLYLMGTPVDCEQMDLMLVVYWYHVMYVVISCCMVPKSPELHEFNMNV